jgi:carbon-monoxide dehydrogenase medium subunit
MYTPTNTRIVVAEFDYENPATLDQAFALLAEHGDQARLIAGGTDLIVRMKLERDNPGCVISLAGVGELSGISHEDGLAIGSMTSIRSISRSALVGDRYQALHEACEAYSTVPIMIMGTIGGNLCNASPAADTAPALLAFDAEVELVSGRGKRTVALHEFFTGPGATVLADDEILHTLRLPEPAAGTGSAFLKISRVVADIAQVCVAVRLERDGKSINDCRIALGAVAPTPVRIGRAEERLTGQSCDPEAIDAAARIVAETISPITDVRATEEYRRTVARVIVRDALTMAWRRAGEGS